MTKSLSAYQLERLLDEAHNSPIQPYIDRLHDSMRYWLEMRSEQTQAHASHRRMGSLHHRRPHKEVAKDSDQDLIRATNNVTKKLISVISEIGPAQAAYAMDQAIKLTEIDVSAHNVQRPRQLHVTLGNGVSEPEFASIARSLSLFAKGQYTSKKFPERPLPHAEVIIKASAAYMEKCSPKECAQVSEAISGMLEGKKIGFDKAAEMLASIQAASSAIAQKREASQGDEKKQSTHAWAALRMAFIRAAHNGVEAMPIGKTAEEQSKRAALLTLIVTQAQEIKGNAEFMLLKTAAERMPSVEAQSMLMKSERMGVSPTITQALKPTPTIKRALTRLFKKPCLNS